MGPAGGSKTGTSGRTSIVLGLLLFLVVAGIYLPAMTHDFITYDDPTYVTQNEHVTRGLSWANVRWAFLSTEASNWHPLTWLSHMADCQLYGVQPGGHHFTSVLLHALNSVLLFAVLRRLTGALWRSLVVAALFGLHPLHVESVAWIAERKDVLSTLFMLLALWSYAARFAHGRLRTDGGAKCYGASLLFFALGLMSKPMLVTLPCVLLLLDFWPLRRWAVDRPAFPWALVLEKIPFFALSAASCVITVFAQGKGGAVASLVDFTWSVRVSNALVAYCRYLGKCFFPEKLAVFYPNFADQPSWWGVALALLLLSVLTVLAAGRTKQRPYLLVGWLWFLGTLVPVIGLVQVGGQTMADRYTYIPLIGVFLAIVWLVGDISTAWPYCRPALGVLTGVVLVACAVLTVHQLGFWKNGITLFRHAAAVTENNFVAHANLFILQAKTSPADAQIELQETKRILGSFAGTFEQKGIALAQTPGHSAEAIKEFRTAIRIMRDIPGPHFNLGLMLAQSPGAQTEAIEEFRAAIRLKPDFADAHYSLALLLAEVPGRQEEAIFEYEQTIRINPNSYQAHFNLGLILANLPGRKEEAKEHFEAALKAKPDLERAREMLERLPQVAPL